MKAIILNSGIGKRMGSLTKDMPKCLVQINEETILGFQLKAFIENGIHNIIITTGPFEYKIKDYIKKHFPELNVEYVNNQKYASTNYIYSVFLTKDLIDDDIILIHGDMVFEKSVLKKLIESEVENSVLINNKIKPPKKDFKGKIENGLVKKIGVNVFGENCFFLAPIYKFSKNTFKLWLNEIENFVKRNEVNVYAENAFNIISEKIKLKPVYFRDEFCIEVDDLDDLEIAKRFFNNK